MSQKASYGCSFLSRENNALQATPPVHQSDFAIVISLEEQPVRVKYDRPEPKEHENDDDWRTQTSRPEWEFEFVGTGQMIGIGFEKGTTLKGKKRREKEHQR